jgi:hypothetical protein
MAALPFLLSIFVIVQAPEAFVNPPMGPERENAGILPSARNFSWKAETFGLISAEKHGKILCKYRVLRTLPELCLTPAKAQLYPLL